MPEQNPWFDIPSPRPDARLRLICLPYAGAGSTLFNTWQDRLPDSIELCTVQMPGRARRISEPAATRMSDLVRDLSLACYAFQSTPFAFYGHSMGAWIAFELSRLLYRMGAKPPLHLFVAGQRAPQLPAEETPVYDLPDAAFKRQLLDYAGTPVELINNDELMRILMPALRADFEICDTYQYQPSDPLPCPITALGGYQDPTCEHRQLEAWRDQTSVGFNCRMFQGEHFFLHTAETKLLEFLGDQLAGC